MEKSRNRAVGRQVRKMIAAAMAAMLVFTSANVADVNAEETVLAVSENAVTGETGAGVVEAEKNTGEPEVENGGAENREAENTDLDAETADPDTETADGTHTYKNGFCTDDGCDAYEPAVLTTGKYDIDANGEITDSDEAYEIGNAGQLYWFAGLVNGTLTDGTAQNLKANAVLTADITVNEDLLASINTDDDGNVTNSSSFKAWRPMGMADEKGNLTGWYTGIFDGNGHSISGLYVNRDEVADDVHTWFKSCIGLFGYYSGVTRNLSVLDSYMRGKDCIGGICGYNDGGTIQNCYSAATVCGDSYIGGICGRSEGDSIIENCYNTGYVYGATRSIGGICGDNRATLQGCYNVGKVNGEFYVGGIVGESSGSGNTIWIKDCYNRGNVIGDTKDIGGIGGYIGSSLVENCYSQATVSGNTNVGGICGNGYKADFQNAYYDSNLYTGNAIGYLKDATIKQTEGKPSQAFESGEIAYLLQADREEPVWGQTLFGNDVQAYPVLGGAKVYQVTEYKGCIESTGIAGTTYNNANAPVFGPHVYENGFCTICSAYEPAVLTTGKYDIDANGEITDSDEAYEIGNAGQLYWFAGLVNGTLTDGTVQNLKANAVLTADIIVNKDLLTSINTDEDGNVTNGTSFRIWLPMGKINSDNGKPMMYAGTFDGKGYSISGVYANLYDAPVEDPKNIYNNKDYAGLFGLHAGVTRNLSVLDSYMRGEDCIGGICGNEDGGTIQNCYSAATVCGDSYIGGICGRSEGDSIIENCYNTGYVYGATRSIGGICGDNRATLQGCYNVGKVNGEFYVGGIVGESSGSGNTIWIKDCYNRGNVIGDTKDIGGIGGYIGSSLVENCYSQATVSGNTNVGGICGNGYKADFQNAYYDSNLYTGNAIGYLKDATIKQTEGKPSQAFESGEIAYLLQAGREEAIWGQTLSGNDVQAYPILGGAKVYQNITYQDCAKDEAHTVYTYANEQKQESYDYTLQEVKAKEPKCTEAGNKAYYKCSVCGKLYTDQEGTNEVSANTVVVPAKGHSFTWIIDREATEQAEGSRHEECSICHEKKAAVAIPKLSSSTQPSQKPSEAPSQKPSGSPSQQPGQDIKVPAKGTKLTAKGASYQVTSAAEKNPTVVYKGSKKQKASVTIPDTVTIDKVTYKVTSIAANAFKNNKKLKKVVIGKNVTKIGKKAFYGCSKLKKITVKTTKLTKKNVGRQAFKGIHKKATFKVPKKKISSYRKVFRARGAAKTTKVTK